MQKYIDLVFNCCNYYQRVCWLERLTFSLHYCCYCGLKVNWILLQIDVYYLHIILLGSVDNWYLGLLKFSMWSLIGWFVFLPWAAFYGSYSWCGVFLILANTNPMAMAIQVLYLIGQIACQLFAKMSIGCRCTFNM